MSKINVIAEIGINHNGDFDIARKLIMSAYLAGFDYVKFQKRNPEKCVSEAQKKEIRRTPWGEMTYLEYKNRLELSKEDYIYIDHICEDLPIKWFASVWDEDSADFMRAFCTMVKIPSAKITDIPLLKYCRRHYEKVILSTGMSTENEIETAIHAGNPDVILHTHSAYPADVRELSLDYMTYLRNKYQFKEIGYSGHEFGLVTTFAAASMGAQWIERHITLDHDMWGSDQKSSVDPVGMVKLVRGIRDIERARGGNCPRIIRQSELEKRKALK